MGKEERWIKRKGTGIQNGQQKLFKEVHEEEPWKMTSVYKIAASQVGMFNNMEDTRLLWSTKGDTMKDTLIQAELFSMEMVKGYWAANVIAGEDIGGFTAFCESLKTGDD